VHEVAGNSSGYASEQEALASWAARFLRMRSCCMATARDWRRTAGSCLHREARLDRRRQDFRDASAIGVNDTGKQGVNFVLTNAGGERTGALPASIIPH
jgi:hypothetical protein